MKNKWIQIFDCYCSDLTIYTNIKTIENDWNALLPDNHHLRSEHLEVYEKSNLDDLTFLYVIIQNKQKQNIGLAYFQLLQFNSKHFTLDILKKCPVDKVKSYILQKKTNLLFCGNLFKNHFPAYYFPDNSHLDELLKIIKEVAQKYNCSGAVLKDNTDLIPQSILAKNRFRQFPEDLIMNLELRYNWDSFDDYLQELSRKYLQRAKKILDSSKEIVVKPLSLDEIISNQDLIENLYNQVCDQQIIRIGKINKHFFVEMKKSYPSQYHLNGLYLNDSLIGFYSYFVSNQKMDMQYIGFDYKLNEKHKLYFNILFEGLKVAIQNKAQQLVLGRTAFEAKASLGAQSEPVTNYIWVKMGIATIVYRNIFKYFSQNQKHEWKKRNPFKQMSSQESANLINI